LRSEESGEAVSMQHQKTFKRALKKFRDWLLRNDDAKRIRTSPFDDVKDKLLQYIELRAQPSFDEFAAPIEMNIEPEPLCSVSWTECLASCDIIKRFLSEKNMEKELIQFEQFQHKLRVKRIDAATNQLSIKSFFRPKPT
jgi:hypothetical protein